MGPEGWGGGEWFTFGLAILVFGFLAVRFTYFGRDRLLPDIRYWWLKLPDGRHKRR